MDSPVVILVLSFVFFLAMNAPIAVSIAMATFLTVLAVGTTSAPTIVAQRMATGIDSFALLAIPFFILSGILMGRGGMARRLIDFADALMGHFTGGLSFVNVLTCMMFGSISGSAVAAVSSVGGFMIPEMRRNGYDNDFSVAVSITAATTGLVIPPSNIMIVYAVVTGSVSVMAMFLAGVLPGILTGVLLMVTSGIISKLRGYGRRETTRDAVLLFVLAVGGGAVVVGLLAGPREAGAFVPLTVALACLGRLAMGLLGRQRPGVAAGSGVLLVAAGAAAAGTLVAGHLPALVAGGALLGAAVLLSFVRGYSDRQKASMRRIARTFFSAILSLLLVVIVLGGILAGVFTPTEAAAIAVVYAFVLGVIVYREFKLREIPEILLQASVTTAVVMLLIGTSQAMSWIMAYQQIPQSVSKALLGLSENPLVILLVINAILLAVGTFMDMTPAVLIFTPIFLPVVTSKLVGMDPVHFGILMIVNLCIGLCTPPVGTCLFVGCGVGETTLARVTPKLLPFFVAMVVALLMVSYVPALSLWLPRSLGY